MIINARLRITHESMLRLLTVCVNPTHSARSAHMHCEEWALRVATVEEMDRDPVNWRLVWREPDLISRKRRSHVESAAADLARRYDVLW